ncbi:TIGR03899 family protein [Aestuariibacter salexigens]|uniref:TIGR03899 family protein n=1 Tax=Aestuariibacter salexigens TaxID=226010 RepID=UPI00047C50E1|nr:TIGR03899 family protein [Aestuariibacter salexigens]
MKIQTPTSASITPVPKRQDNKASKTREADNKADKVDRQQLHSRMSQWFAQVGVSPSTDAILQSDIDRRARRRQQMMAARKLKNLEAVLNVALTVNIDSGRPEHIDADWFFSFIDLAENIHSPHMQDVWGKIFAVETSRPGSFSLNTLQVLKQLTHREAKMFTTAVNLSSKRKFESTPRILVGFNQRPALWKLFTLSKTHQLNLSEFGLAYPDLLSLIDMKLIYNSELESGELSTESSSQWRCGERTFYLAARRPGIALKYYKFTPVGAELARLFGVKHHAGYVDALLATMKSGFEIT